MEKIKSTLLIIFIVTVLTACGGKGNGPAPSTPPTSGLLIFPEKYAPCIVGESSIGDNSTVTFKWQKATVADSYEITIKNLESNSLLTKSSTEPQLSISLSLNTPYSWFVTSKVKNSNETAKSETWRFYNSGPGVSSYAPFPAEITSPFAEQKISAVVGTVTLTWDGKDIDNDIVDYDVYLGTSESPALLKSHIADSKYVAPVASKAKYYWKVITRDSKNNISDSGLFEFLVN